MAVVKGKKPPAAKNKGGRPTLYQPDYARQAYELALLGLDDVEMARVFDVGEKTIHNWKHAHPEFLQALREGKDIADARVTRRLYERAMGYSHDAVKIVADAKTKEEHIVHYTEHYPPDTTACIFWLKNRQRARWRDRIDNTHSGDAQNPVVALIGQLNGSTLPVALHDDSDDN